MQLEEPNKWLAKVKVLDRITKRPPDQVFDGNPKITKILTIDKYSTEEFGYPFLLRTPRQYVFFPTSESRLPSYIPWNKRDFDLVYSGTMFPEVIAILEKLNSLDLKLCVISHSSSPLVTHRDVSYNQKLDLVARAKFSLVHNQLFLDKPHLASLLHRDSKIFQHGAFSHLTKEICHSGLISNSGKRLRAPQLKSRLFEASMVGSIPLVAEDRWRLADDWFERDEHFIPFTEEQVIQSVERVMTDQRDYEAMGLDLQKFSRGNYTTRHFASAYLMD